LRNETLSRQIYELNYNEMNEILSQVKEKYISNHFLLDTNFVNVYFPNEYVSIKKN